MGYMMMQCGVGAFSAAVLHLIMHGFYKANAFLSAAGRVNTKPITFSENGQDELPSAYHRGVAALIAGILLVFSILTLGIDVSQKPGGIFLSLFLWFSATQAIAPALKNPSGATPLLVVVGLSYGGMLLYWTALGAVTAFLDPVLMLGNQNPIFGELNSVLVASIAAIYVGVFVLVEVARMNREKTWAKRFYVLCLNHFYIEQIWRKAVHRILGDSNLMPSFETLAIPTQVLKEKKNVYSKS
ncbi:hypothetical protein EBT16_14805 [bacterium]|nr:hypothetical protein [bacterium]